MSCNPQFIIAPNFVMSGPLADRLQLADGDGWRTPGEAESISLVPANPTREQLGDIVCLFIIPGHMRQMFWSMMEQAAPGGQGANFDPFAAEVSRFLTFKQLPPPEAATLELVLHLAGGSFDAWGMWAVLNLGDDPVTMAFPGLRLRLDSGTGCRLPVGVEATPLPPTTDVPNVLLVVRRP